MDETLSAKNTEKNETLHEVTVRFGDVFEWYGQGHLGDEFITTAVIDGLRAIPVNHKRGNIPAVATITGPIKVKSHLDFDQILRTYLGRMNEAQVQLLGSEIESYFREEESAGEAIYSFTDEIPS